MCRSWLWFWDYLRGESGAEVIPQKIIHTLSIA
jgi:hypothetical protein